MRESAASPRPSTVQQVEAFVDAVYDPDDIIEIRRLPSGVSTWHTAAQLSDTVEALNRDNRRGQNIYIGANPRPCKGERGDACIVRANCLFADFDGEITVDDALGRIEGNGLPRPTVTIWSGHGVHTWWRLDDPVDDLDQWRQWQKGLAALLGSDQSICNPERIMRLPGFRNHKDPPADCYIVECDPDRTYGIETITTCFTSETHEVTTLNQGCDAGTTRLAQGPSATPDVAIDQIVDAAKYANSWPPAQAGERNRQAVYHAFQLLHDWQLPKSVAWLILQAWNRTNKPPLDESELKICLVNGERYGGKDQNIRPKVGKPVVAGAKWYTLPDLYSLPAYREGLIPVTTGFTSLDRWLNGGFRPANTYVIGGRTGSAKSTLAANIVRRAALAGVNTLLLKLEETATEAVWRMHAATDHVPLRCLLDGTTNVKHEDAIRLDEAWALLRDMPIRVSDNHDLSQIRHIVKDHKAQGGQLVVVDQMSGVSVPDANSPFERMSLISNAIRDLANEYHLPIVVVCQVNREGAKTSRSNSKDPVRRLDPYDLRDSGMIENDAAGVLLINNIKRFDAPHNRVELHLNVIVGKNRYGKIHDSSDHPIPLQWSPAICRIDDDPEEGGTA